MPPTDILRTRPTQEAATVATERTGSSREEEQRTIEVEVAWAEPSRQVLRKVSVAPGTTLREVVEMSGLCADFPEAAERRQDLGVFGRRMDPDTPVRPGDRVEIYRPLLADPKESRRSRARAQSEARRRCPRATRGRG